MLLSSVLLYCVEESLSKPLMCPLSLALKLCLKDIAEVITANPEVLVVGSGASGLVKVLPEVERNVKTQGIKLIVEATDKACHTYNHICHSQSVVAALHITC